MFPYIFYSNIFVMGSITLLFHYIFNFIGIEKEEEYIKIAEARIESYKKELTLL